MNLYHLTDEKGVTTTVELPIVLNIGAQFEHESGRYFVDHLDYKDGKVIRAYCELVEKRILITDALKKGKSFKKSIANL